MVGRDFRRRLDVDDDLGFGQVHEVSGDDAGDLAFRCVARHRERIQIELQRFRFDDIGRVGGHGYYRGRDDRSSGFREPAQLPGIPDIHTPERQIGTYTDGLPGRAARHGGQNLGGIFLRVIRILSERQFVHFMRQIVCRLANR